MKDNIILDTKQVKDIEGRFYVPSYQRGYRWGKEEVRRLLEDVEKYGKSIKSENSSYCLQPVVVRNMGEEYELIDGQQRLTTIYLIYKYLYDFYPKFFKKPRFSLTYETREKSEEFLKNIDMDKSEDNIDFYFMANAYKTIKEWFEEDEQIRALHIYEYFEERVQIIWYEVGDETDAISLFTRLNIGKIPLTSSELVKAMFLSRDGDAEIDRRKQEEISLQWDMIERQLHDDKLWYFLTNTKSVAYATRIDLILDLITKKKEDCREKYFSFFWFDKERQTTSSDDLWQKIQKTFLILKDWFENHELYHKVGYLIASGQMKINEIFLLSENRKKSEFTQALDEAIAKSLETGKNYGELSYENTWEHKKITNLLLLFNVMSMMRAGKDELWFPFDKFKYGKSGKIGWSLEHIHAQHSDAIRTKEGWKQWLSLHMESVKAVGGSADLLEKMQYAVDKNDLMESEFEILQEAVTALLSESGSGEYLHSIANLALLTIDDNAALSNSTFDVKRNEIIRMDKMGRYIPFCTKMVFLKYYTPSKDNQIHFWGQADREAYVAEINSVLEKYLKEPIRLEILNS